jgi:hypothetical protein
MEQIDSQMSDLRAILPPSQQRSGSNSAFPPPSRYGGRLGGASSEASTPPPSALHGDNSAPRPGFYSMTSSHSLGSQEGEGRGSVGANKRKSDDAEFDDEVASGGKGMRSKRNRVGLFLGAAQLTSGSLAASGRTREGNWHLWTIG